MCESRTANFEPRTLEPEPQPGNPRTSEPWHPTRRPAYGVLALREMEQGRRRRQSDADRRGHRVHGDRGLGGLQQPWRMVDLEAVGPAGTIHRIQAIALRQEVLERPRFGP